MTHALPTPARVAAVFVTTAFCLLTTALPARADDASSMWNSFVDINDTHGIPVWNHELSLDRGGITEIDKYNWSFLIDGWWGNYRTLCSLALWFMDFVMSFEWVTWIATPVLMIGDALDSVIDSLGLTGTFLSIMAISAGIWALRGKNSTAVYEFFIASLIAALASGLLADPVRLVAGPDGLIVGAAQTGQQIAAEIVDPGSTQGKTPDELRAAQTGVLVDIFVRQPTQLINYGRVIDGTGCEDEYDDVVREGPYGKTDDIRQAMGDCNEDLGEFAENPSADMANSAFVFSLAGIVLIALGIAIAGAVVAAAVNAMFQSLKAIVNLVTALLPGGRGGLYLTIAQTAAQLLIIVFASVFLSLFLLVVQELFATDTGGSLTERFIVADAAIVAGVVVFWNQRKRIKAAAYRWAERLAWRPGGRKATVGPTRLPDRSQALSLPNMANATSAVTNILNARYMRTIANAIRGRDADPGPKTDAPKPSTGPDTPPPGGSARPAPPTSGPTSPTQPGGNNPPPTSPTQPAAPATPVTPAPPAPSPGERLRSRGKGMAGTLASAGTHAVLAYASGGSSTLVTGAARAVQAARLLSRASLQARMVTRPPRQEFPVTPTQPPSASVSPSHPAVVANRPRELTAKDVRPQAPTPPSPVMDHIRNTRPSTR